VSTQSRRAICRLEKENMPVEVNLVTNNNVPSDQHITRGIRPIEDIRVSKVLYASKDKPDLPVATSSSTIEKTHKELKVGQLVLEHPQKFVTSNEKVVSVLPEVKPAEGGEVGYCWTGPLSNDHNKEAIMNCCLYRHLR
jgi:hypothetical protein